MWAKKCVQQKRDWYQAHAILAASYAELDRLDDARAAVDEYGTVFPSASISGVLRIPFRQSADAERLAIALRKAGLPE